MPKPTHVPEVPRVAWSPVEIAAGTGLSYQRVLDEIRAGRLRAVRVGKHLRVSDKELHRWLEDGQPQK